MVERRGVAEGRGEDRRDATAGGSFESGDDDNDDRDDRDKGAIGVCEAMLLLLLLLLLVLLVPARVEQMRPTPP